MPCHIVSGNAPFHCISLCACLHRRLSRTISGKKSYLIQDRPESSSPLAQRAEGYPCYWRLRVQCRCSIPSSPALLAPDFLLRSLAQRHQPHPPPCTRRLHRRLLACSWLVSAHLSPRSGKAGDSVFARITDGRLWKWFLVCTMACEKF